MSSAFVDDVAAVDAAVSRLPPGMLDGRATASPAAFQFTYVPPGATCAERNTARRCAAVPRPPRCSFSVSGDHWCPG